MFQMFSLPDNVYQTEPELNQLENSFTALNTLDNIDNTNHDEDSDEGEIVRNDFDIEALVDECFMNQKQKTNQFNEPIIDQS